MDQAMLVKVVLEVQEVVMVIKIQVLVVQEQLVKEMMAEVVLEVQLHLNMEQVEEEVLVL